MSTDPHLPDPQRRPGGARFAGASGARPRAPRLRERPSAGAALPAREGTGRAPRSTGLIFLRYLLPALIVIAGAIVMAFGSEVDLEGGGAIVSAGLATYFLNWLFRLGATGDLEREREDAAREYFDRHGRWPS